MCLTGIILDITYDYDTILKHYVEFEILHWKVRHCSCEKQIFFAESTLPLLD